MASDNQTPSWRRLWCRIFGHRWFVNRDLSQPMFRCARCGDSGGIGSAE